MLSGSFRRSSYNRALLRAAARLAPSGVPRATFVALRALPFYDGDVEDEGPPGTAAALRRAIVEADALLLATPESNGATSGVLKDAPHWASRGPARILAGKAVAVPVAARAFGADLVLHDAEVCADVAELVVELVGRARSSSALAA